MIILGILKQYLESLDKQDVEILDNLESFKQDVESLDNLESFKQDVESLDELGSFETIYRKSP